MRWLLPIGLIVLSVPVGVLVANMFPNTNELGNIVVFGGIVSAMLATFIHQFLPVSCPICGKRLEYYLAKNSKMPRYTCKHCQFTGR